MALADFVRNAGKVRGWHWSGMRTRMGDLGWSYTKVLRQNIDPSDRVLDVGTGGGEVFSGVARPQDTALDFKMEMLQVARENLPCHLVAGDHRALPFDTGSFDVVADRHVGADAREVLRVLRPRWKVRHAATRRPNLPEHLRCVRLGDERRLLAARGGCGWRSLLGRRRRGRVFAEAGCEIVRRE